jgi:hypothetical protein
LAPGVLRRVRHKIHAAASGTNQYGIAYTPIAPPPCHAGGMSMVSWLAHNHAHHGSDRSTVSRPVWEAGSRRVAWINVTCPRDDANPTVEPHRTSLAGSGHHNRHYTTERVENA